MDNFKPKIEIRALPYAAIRLQYVMAKIEIVKRSFASITLKTLEKIGNIRFFPKLDSEVIFMDSLEYTFDED